MGEVGDIWRAVRNASQADRTRRLFQANAEFAQAKALAENAGFQLRQCTEAHYQLSALDGSWKINLFPSTFRVIAQESKKAPFAPRIALSYNEEWTLLDLIQKLTNESKP